MKKKKKWYDISPRYLDFKVSNWIFNQASRHSFSWTYILPPLEFTPGIYRFNVKRDKEERGGWNQFANRSYSCLFICTHKIHREIESHLQANQIYAHLAIEIHMSLRYHQFMNYIEIYIDMWMKVSLCRVFSFVYIITNYCHNLITCSITWTTLNLSLPQMNDHAPYARWIIFKLCI